MRGMLGVVVAVTAMACGKDKSDGASKPGTDKAPADKPAESEPSSAVKPCTDPGALPAGLTSFVQSASTFDPEQGSRKYHSVANQDRQAINAAWTKVEDALRADGWWVIPARKPGDMATYAYKEADSIWLVIDSTYSATPEHRLEITHGRHILPMKEAVRLPADATAVTRMGQAFRFESKSATVESVKADYERGGWQAQMGGVYTFPRDADKPTANASVGKELERWTIIPTVDCAR